MLFTAAEPVTKAADTVPWTHEAACPDTRDEERLASPWGAEAGDSSGPSGWRSTEEGAGRVAGGWAVWRQLLTDQWNVQFPPESHSKNKKPTSTGLTSQVRRHREREWDRGSQDKAGLPPGRPPPAHDRVRGRRPWAACKTGVRFSCSRIGHMGFLL